MTEADSAPHDDNNQGGGVHGSAVAGQVGRDQVTHNHYYNNNTLGQPPCQDSTLGKKKTAKESEVTDDRLLVISLVGSLKDTKINRLKLEAIERELQRLADDDSLTFIKVEEGSIKITISGSASGLQKLKDLIDSGELTDVEGIPIQQSAFLNADATHQVERKVNSTQMTDTALQRSTATDVVPVQEKTALFFRKPSFNPLDREKSYCLRYRHTLHKDASRDSIQRDIEDLQAALMRKGFLGKITGEFDEATEAAVRKVQRENRIRPNGVVGFYTWAAALFFTLRRGEANNSHEVKRLQELLNQESLGFGVVVDGVFGPRTERALEKFQSRHGLLPDGICGPRTWVLLTGERPEERTAGPTHELSLFNTTLNRLILSLGALFQRLFKLWVRF